MAEKDCQVKQATANETAVMIEGLYNGIARDLQKVKKEICNELKYSSLQIGSYYDVGQKAAAQELAKSSDNVQAIADEVKKVREELSNLSENSNEALVAKIDAIEAKLALVQEIESAVAELDEKLVALNEKLETVQPDVEVISEKVAEKVKDVLPAPAENVDYDQIVDRTAEKVVESLPYSEKIDYKQIEEFVQASAIDYKQIEELVQASAIDTVALGDEISDKVAEKLPVPEAIDYERLADTVLAKMPQPEPIDYETLADTILAKMPQPEPIDYEALAERVAQKIMTAEAEKEPESYDVVLDEEGIDKIAEAVAAKLNLVELVNYDELSDKISEKIAVKVELYEDEEVAEEIELDEVEEDVEEEVALTDAEETVHEYIESGDDLVDAETGMVIRLKRSFTAKLKQSNEDVKGYYDQIKNELISYKRGRTSVKSTVSWQCDRFNLGRATIAKMNICGKTLCFYVDLDPNDPELKQSVFHQKDVGEQKAYQKTPFKVKVKSELGAKRAVRLVKYLADKHQAEKKVEFVPTDYVEELAYETTKELLDKGLIKETKEKKNAFSF